MAAYIPTDYNAIADGVTDDTHALQACIDAAHAAKEDVYLGAKSYRVTGTLVIPGGMAMFGESLAETSFIHDPPTHSIDLLHVDAASDVLLRDFSLKSKSGNSRHAVNLYRARRATLIALHVINAPGVSRPWSTGLYIERGLQCTYDDLEVEECSTAGLYFNYVPGQGQTTTQTFRNCRFRQCGRGVDSEDVAAITTRFFGCTVETCTVVAARLGERCQMDWFSPHVENVPMSCAGYPIFVVGQDAKLNVFGGHLGGYSGNPHANSSIIEVNGAKLVALYGANVDNAAKVIKSGATGNALILHGVVSGCDERGDVSGFSQVSDLASQW